MNQLYIAAVDNEVRMTIETLKDFKDDYLNDKKRNGGEQYKENSNHLNELKETLKILDTRIKTLLDLMKQS